MPEVEAAIEGVALPAVLPMLSALLPPRPPPRSTLPELGLATATRCPLLAMLRACAAKALHGWGIESAYVDLFRAARFSILVMQPYFGNLRLHEAMLEALNRRRRHEEPIRLRLIKSNFYI